MDFSVCSRASAEPVGKTVGQDAIYCPSVECFHDLDRGFGLFQSPQEMEALLGLVRSVEFDNQVMSSAMCTPRSFVLLTLSTAVL